MQMPDVKLKKATHVYMTYLCSKRIQRIFFQGGDCKQKTPEEPAFRKQTHLVRKHRHRQAIRFTNKSSQFTEFIKLIHVLTARR